MHSSTNHDVAIEYAEERATLQLQFTTVFHKNLGLCLTDFEVPNASIATVGRQLDCMPRLPYSCSVTLSDFAIALTVFDWRI